MSDLEKTLQAMIEREVSRQLAAARPANDAPVCVTIAEYARARSISESTVRLAIREGRLPAQKIGRAVRIKPTDEIAKPHRADRVAQAQANAHRRLRRIA